MHRQVSQFRVFRNCGSSAKCRKSIEWPMSLSWCIGSFRLFKTRKKKPQSFRERCEEPYRMFSKNCVVWTSTWAQKPDQCHLFSTTFCSPLNSCCNIFSHNISFLHRIIPLWATEGVHRTSPHAHYSQRPASPCQFVCFCGVVSLLFTCTTRARGSRYKLFFYDRRVLRASQQNILCPRITSLLGVPTLSTFCSTPPPSRTPSPQTLTGIRSNPCALRQEDGHFGPLATRPPTTSPQRALWRTRSHV